MYLRAAVRSLFSGTKICDLVLVHVLQTDASVWKMPLHNHELTIREVIVGVCAQMPILFRQIYPKGTCRAEHLHVCATSSLGARFGGELRELGVGQI